MSGCKFAFKRFPLVLYVYQRQKCIILYKRSEKHKILRGKILYKCFMFFWSNVHGIGSANHKNALNVSSEYKIFGMFSCIPISHLAFKDLKKIYPRVGKASWSKLNSLFPPRPPRPPRSPPRPPLPPRSPPRLGGASP